MAYTLTGEKCGTVRLDPKTTGVVVTESVQRSSKVTSNPVEQGANITDHVVADPIKFTISGIFIGGDDQAAVLRRMWQEKDLLEYVGKNRISSCVITNYKADSKADNKDGEAFTLQMQVVNIASSEYVATGAQLMSTQDKATGGGGGISKSSSSSQTKSTSSGGTKSTVNSAISSSAYAKYVNSYNGKSKSSGPSTRKTSAYSAA